MGLFKKSYQKNIVKDKEALTDYAVMVNRLLLFAEGHESVVVALKELQDDLHYTSVTADTDAKKSRKNIGKYMEQLDNVMSQPTWSEADVLHYVKLIRAEIVTHSVSI